jgi:four helix bundle protein
MIGNLESLDAWRVAKDLARDVWRLSTKDPIRRHWGMADQLQRAAASVPANLIEGYALGTTPQFIRFIRTALGSAAELKLHLWLAAESGLVEPTAARELAATCDRVISLLVRLLRRLGARAPSR